MKQTALRRGLDYLFGIAAALLIVSEDPPARELAPRGVAC